MPSSSRSSARSSYNTYKYVKSAAGEVYGAYLDRYIYAQAAQGKALEAVATPTSERDFEPTSYLSMTKAHLASEKVGIISTQIAGMQQLLKTHGYGPQD